jgi:hypothetical protein
VIGTAFPGWQLASLHDWETFLAKPGVPTVFAKPKFFVRTLVVIMVWCGAQANTPFDGDKPFLRVRWRYPNCQGCERIIAKASCKKMHPQNQEPEAVER